ncbi:hypothetical protein Tco_0159983, partial [Tanacetum coccineum]
NQSFEASRLVIFTLLLALRLLRTLLVQNLAAIDDLKEMVKDELEGVCGGEVAAGSLEPKGGDVVDFRAM